MAWSNLLANQMVSEIDAQTSGFTLKSGQSHGTTNLCLTKQSAFLKYNLLANTNTNGLASNQLMRKDFWVTGDMISTTITTICNQIWTIKNLDVTNYRDSTPIPQVTDPTQWAKLTTGAWCYYNNDPANGAIYGKLYNWYAVNDPRGLAPQGYHIPSDAEWAVLTSCLGGTSIAGVKMKEIGTSHWISSYSGAATNSSGFTGLPGGYRHNDGSFNVIGYHGNFWSSTNSLSRLLTHDSDSAPRNTSSNPDGKGYSVRCIKD